jgi:AcrR family transcriptional regulator
MQSQQQILHAAKTLFTRKGYSNVSMRDICREADVTAPTVYYYFKNKEALFEAVVLETITMQGFSAILSAECKKVRNKGPSSEIETFVRVYLSSFPNKLINTGLYLRRSTQLDPVGTRTLLRELARVESLLVRIIGDGIRNGQFRETDPRMASGCLLGMMNRFIFQRIHFKRNYRAIEAALYLSNFFLRAMKKSEEG